MLKTIALKDEQTLDLRQQILSKIVQAQETDRADESLCTLSFQSINYLERHAWIDTDGEFIAIDLEDWRNENEWDNAIARVSVSSIEVAVVLLKDWFSGDRLHAYTNLNQSYELITPPLAMA